MPRDRSILRAFLCHCFGKLFSAEHMEVNVPYRLARILAAVVDNAIAVCDAGSFCNLRQCLKELSDHGAVCGIDLVCACRNMRLGDHDNMHGRLRINIVERIYLRLLIHLFRGDVPAYDLTKQAIHIRLPFLSRITMLSVAYFFSKIKRGGTL